jgi:hypothetical protein
VIEITENNLALRGFVVRIRALRAAAGLICGQQLIASFAVVFDNRGKGL